jgi:hypothetical protein
MHFSETTVAHGAGEESHVRTHVKPNTLALAFGANPAEKQEFRRAHTGTI